jgi:hypothetical protein
MAEHEIEKNSNKSKATMVELKREQDEGTMEELER